VSRCLSVHTPRTEESLEKHRQAGLWSENSKKKKLEPNHRDSGELVGNRQADSRYCSLLPYDGAVGGHLTGPRAGQKTVRGWRWERTGVADQRQN
jgi:hypothetical protein